MDAAMNAREQNDRMHQCPQRAAATFDDIEMAKSVNPGSVWRYSRLRQSIPSSIGFRFVAESRCKFKRRSFQGWARFNF
jgi:hypothetical protein